jgi:hypothetical protein
MSSKFFDSLERVRVDVQSLPELFLLHPFHSFTYFSDPGKSLTTVVYQPGVNFTNKTYLCAAFTPVAPQSVRTQSSCQYLFTLLGSTSVKAVRRMLMKLSLGVKIYSLLALIANAVWHYLVQKMSFSFSNKTVPNLTITSNFYVDALQCLLAW